MTARLHPLLMVALTTCNEPRTGPIMDAPIRQLDASVITDAGARRAAVDARLSPGTLDGLDALPTNPNPVARPTCGGGPSQHNDRAEDTPKRRDAGTRFTDAGSPPLETNPPRFAMAPRLSQNPNPWAPLVLLLEYATDSATNGTVVISGGGEQWTITPPRGPNVMLPLAGLKPSEMYRITVSAENEHGVAKADPMTWTTPALPADFPTLEVTNAIVELAEPGMTLVAPRYYNPEFRAPIVLVDNEGVVRWYYNDPDFPVLEDLRFSNGEFLFISSPCVITSVDVLGNRTRTWFAANNVTGCSAPTEAVSVPLLAFHHEAARLPNYDIVTLSGEIRQIDGYPTSVDDPDAPEADAMALCSAISEFTSNGLLTKYIALADLLDPLRVGRGSLGGPWASTFSDGPLLQDWDHANAVTFDSATNAYYVSLRNQDAVVKIDRATEELRWILGTPSNWRDPWAEKLLVPVGEVTWPYHQHAVEVNPLGIALYDNGNYRASAYEPYDSEATFSRAVIFSVDEASMTVSQVWEYGAPEAPLAVFSPSMGDADYLPQTGNMLITHSVLSDRAGNVSAKVVEVTRTGEEVFVLEVRAPWASTPTSATLYRAARVPDLRLTDARAEE